MRAHTRKHHTENYVPFKVDDPMSSKEVTKRISGDLPEWAIALKGLRYREGLTQTELGEMLGVEQTNISKMEQGKRPIGKTIAKRIAKVFKSDYRIFL